MTIMAPYMPQSSRHRAPRHPASKRAWRGCDLLRDSIRDGASAKPKRQWPCLRGRYLIHKAIVRGPSFHVYRAWDLRLQREVALKILLRHITDDDAHWALACRRFAAEAFAMMMVQPQPSTTEVPPAHHIVKCYGLLKEARAQIIVMEYLDGVSLRTWMETQRPTQQELLAICQGVGLGLAQIHKAGMVHRDVKPENVMITKSGRVVLIDLGIAYQVATGYEPEEAGMVRGTPGYLAPEQLNAMPLTPATDIYALGVLLYELLTGKSLFPGENMQQLLMTHMAHRIPSMRAYAKDKVGKSLVAMIKRCLQRAPASRFQDFGELWSPMGAHLA